jgi:hypothetical protein
MTKPWNCPGKGRRKNESGTVPAFALAKIGRSPLESGSHSSVGARGWRRLAVLFALLATGCGSGGEPAVPARGTVTDAGEPLHVAGRDVGIGMVVVQFYRLGDDGQAASLAAEAQAQADGAFDAPGRDGRGLPPGKYLIAVRQWDPFPTTDKLGGRFDEKRSKIVRELDGREIVIDVSKPEG